MVSKKYNLIKTFVSALCCAAVLLLAVPSLTASPVVQHQPTNNNVSKADGQETGHFSISKISQGLFTPQLAMAQDLVEYTASASGTNPGGARSTEPGNAPASSADDIDNTILSWIGYVLEFLNNYILSWVITTAANWLNGLVRVTNMANNQAVIIGWTVLRDFANMFFIFIMLIIAIATILRFEEYGVRRLLFKVILIALLINFSRLFAFAVIDFSHVFLNAFLNAFPNNDIAGALAEGMNINKAFAVPDNPSAGPSKWWLLGGAGGWVAGQAYNAIASLWSKDSSDWVILSALAFNTIILTVIALALLAATVLFIVRIIWLWFLIMVAPIAFMAYMFPWGAISQWWSKWWSNLFKWAFVAPIFMFFIYITVVIIKSGALSSSIFQDANQATANIPGLQIDTLQIAASPPFMLQMIIIAGFLIGGLLMAVNMAGAAGQFVLNAGKWGGAKLVGGAAWVGRKGQAATGRYAQRRAEREATAGRGPSLTTQALARVGAGAQQREKSDIEARKAQLKSQYGDNKLALQARLLTAVRPSEKAAIAARLDEVYGGLRAEEGDTAMRDKLTGAAREAYRLGVQIKTRPDLAPEGQLSRAVSRLSTEDAKSLSKDAMSEPVVREILRQKGSAFLTKMASENDEATREFITRTQQIYGNNFEAMMAGIGQENQQLADWIKTAPAAGGYRWGRPAPKEEKEETQTERADRERRERMEATARRGEEELRRQGRI